jgi:hypothetical protein
VLPVEVVPLPLEYALATANPPTTRRAKTAGMMIQEKRFIAVQPAGE